MKHFVLATFVIANGFFSTNVSAMVICRINGKEVSSTPENFTGVMTCKHDDGKLNREESFVNGKKIGRQVMITFDDHRIESTTDTNEQKTGIERKYFPSGKLKETNEYSKGKQQGLQHRYFENGTLISKAWYDNGSETTRIDWTEKGKLYRVECGDKEFFKEQGDLCGFRGEKEIEFFNGKGEVVAKEKYLNGKLLASSAHSGKDTIIDTEQKGPNTRAIIVKSKKTKTVLAKFQVQSSDGINFSFDGSSEFFFEDGKIKSKSTWKNGTLLSETEFYQNGKMSVESKFSKVSEKETRGQRSYYTDSGLLNSESEFLVNSYDYRQYGYHASENYSTQSIVNRYYGKDGKMAFEYHYDKDGNLKNSRELLKSGKFSLKEYFPDGSTKSEKVE